MEIDSESCREIPIVPSGHADYLCGIPALQALRRFFYISPRFLVPLSDFLLLYWIWPMFKLRVTLDHYATFLRVAACHRMDRTAEQLGLSESAVRKQIEAVESALGTRLFEHRKGALFLTSDGRALYEDALQILDMAGVAEQRIAARHLARERKLRVGHSTNLPARMIAAIHRLHIDGEAPVMICHTSGLTSTVLRQVIEGSLHAGIGVLPATHPKLLVHPLGSEAMLVAMPPNHRLAARGSIPPEALDGEPMIAVARDPWPERHREIEEHLAQFGAKARVVADAYSTPEALGLVEQGVGICMAARSAVSLRHVVVLRPLTASVLKRRYGIFFREDNHSTLLEDLAEAARAACAAGRPVVRVNSTVPARKTS